MEETFINNSNKLIECPKCDSIMSAVGSLLDAEYKCFSCNFSKEISTTVIIAHSSKHKVEESSTVDYRNQNRVHLPFPSIFRKCTKCKKVTKHKKITDDVGTIHYVCREH